MARRERAAEHLVELRGEIARLESELQQKKTNLVFGTNLEKFWWIREKANSKNITNKLGMKIEGERNTIWVPGVPIKVAKEIGEDKTKLLNALLDKIIRIPERIEKNIGLKR